MQNIQLSADTKQRIRIMSIVAQQMKHQNSTPPTEDQIIGFLLFLEDVPFETFKKAARWLVDNRTWYPTVAEFREAIREVDENRAPLPGEAWGEVLRAVHTLGHWHAPTFSHPVILSAVEAMGWRALCMSDEADASYYMNRFMQIYQQLLTRHENDTRQALTADSNAFGMLAGLAKSKALEGGK